MKPKRPFKLNGCKLTVYNYRQAWPEGILCSLPRFLFSDLETQILVAADNLGPDSCRIFPDKYLVVVELAAGWRFETYRADCGPVSRKKMILYFHDDVMVVAYDFICEKEDADES